MSERWDEKSGVAANAATVLPRMTEDYFDAGEALFDGGKTPEELHRFRLRTKHFRYTLEMFDEQYRQPFAVLLKKLKPVQEALGGINDAATALDWLREGESDRARSFLEASIASESGRFEHYWKTVFDKPGERARWLRVLAKPARAAASGSGGETGSRDRQ